MYDPNEIAALKAWSVDVRAEDLEGLARVPAVNAVRSAALRGLVVRMLTRRGSA
jgi:hypothetical protein